VASHLSPRSGARRTPERTGGSRRLHAALSEALRGEVRFDVTARATYSTDASNYRHVPIGVAYPADASDVVALMELSAQHGFAVLARGAGTSVAGQATNAAVVVDFTRSMNRLVDLDPASGTARVQPGLVLDELRRAAGHHGLTFGPDPSTHSRCTLGGMIGNNACGAHSVRWGKTVDTVQSLAVVTAGGARFDAAHVGGEALERRGAEPGESGRIHRALLALRQQSGPALDSAFPRIPRRVSGYNLDELTRADGMHVARALVGTEGTCAIVVEAAVTLVPAPPARALVVVPYPDSPAAAEAVMELRALEPLAIEGLDRSLVDALRAARPDDRALQGLPPGGAWLYVETGGDTVRQAEERAADVIRAAGRPGALTVAGAHDAAELWRIREDGVGFATRLPGGGEAYPGWEDAAVPPERLGPYLRAFTALLAEHRLQGAYYGHYGDGCIHIRIGFDLLGDEGVRRFRRFVEESADLVVAHGGSLSGEHGDGQARGELLSRMYPAEVISAFEAFKGIWDPDDRMNPGRIVRPRPLDRDLRWRTARARIPLRTSLAFGRDADGFAGSTRRCVGVGKCLSAQGGVMCPSYRATGLEEHSTRGRARLLFEMASGQLVRGGWRSPEVRDALDLCLSCKGCKRDCPVGVDMAAYKAEFLSHHYKRRLRPRSHYSMGWLPLWLALASCAPRAANALTGRPAAATLLKRMGGIAPERSLPTLAAEPLRRWFRRRSRAHAGDPEAGPAGRPALERVVVFPDTFTNAFEPQIGRAAIAVLEHLGYAVEMPGRPVCCGLPWLSTGQIGMARRVLRRSADVLAPWLDAGVPIVGLEPSCCAMLRADAAELLGPHDTAAARLGAATRSFSELLRDGSSLPAAAGGRRHGPEVLPARALVQIHCHQHAEWGSGADAEVLERLGVAAEVLDAGCCGLAGNFGFERGHYDVSLACGEHALLPAIRAMGPDSVAVVDGFSCRTQIRQATGVEPVHLAQLVAGHLGVADLL
jgi:FAD/FMN-containing dehydrogenase/Fe-S oxidoreductase